MDALLVWCVTNPLRALACIMLVVGLVIYALDQLGFSYARNLRAGGTLTGKVAGPWDVVPYERDRQDRAPRASARRCSCRNHHHE